MVENFVRTQTLYNLMIYPTIDYCYFIYIYGIVHMSGVTSLIHRKNQKHAPQ